jgi:hypothetical protein
MPPRHTPNAEREGLDIAEEKQEPLVPSCLARIPEFRSSSSSARRSGNCS